MRGERQRENKGMIFIPLNFSPFLSTSRDCEVFIVVVHHHSKAIIYYSNFPAQSKQRNHLLVVLDFRCGGR